jgi:hypothetical protein
VDAASEQTIDNDLMTIALVKKLGKTANDSLLWLASQRKEWLILFNNADDINLNLGHYFPAGSHGNIIITSRNPDLSQHAHAECKIDQMDLEEAIDLLLSAAKHDIGATSNREIARRIVEVSNADNITTVPDSSVIPETSLPSPGYCTCWSLHFILESSWQIPGII